MVAETLKWQIPFGRHWLHQLLAWALLMPGLAWAADPYQVVVPVADQSAEVRQEAEREALQQVLWRLTARRGLADRHAQVEEALATPQRYFQRQGYARLGSDTAEQSEARWMLELRADRDAVLSLLGDIGVPAWTGARPEVLVAVVMEDDRGRRELLGPEAEVNERLIRAARAAALPLTLPIYDLDDMMQVSARDLWAGFDNALEPLLQRYGTDSGLVLRLYQTTLGQWHADWRGEIAGQWLEGAAEVEEPAAAGPLLMEALLSRWVERFGLELGALEGDADSLWIQVDGLSGVGAYAQMMQYLQELSAVSEVRLVDVSGSSLLLQLRSAAELTRVLDVLRIEGRLVPREQPEGGAGAQVWRAWWRAEGS